MGWDLLGGGEEMGGVVGEGKGEGRGGGGEGEKGGFESPELNAAFSVK